MWHRHRFPASIRTNTVEYANNNTTVTNIHGGWNVVQFGNFPILPFGLYHYTFKGIYSESSNQIVGRRTRTKDLRFFLVDQFPCNGMMIALATGEWRGVYPGSGNAGITIGDKVCIVFTLS